MITRWGPSIDSTYPLGETLQVDIKLETLYLSNSGQIIFLRYAKAVCNTNPVTVELHQDKVRNVRIAMRGNFSDAG